MPLTNAEKQQRYQDRKNERAAAIMDQCEKATTLVEEMEQGKIERKEGVQAVKAILNKKDLSKMKV